MTEASSNQPGKPSLRLCGAFAQAALLGAFYIPAIGFLGTTAWKSGEGLVTLVSSIAKGSPAPVHGTLNIIQESWNDVPVAKLSLGGAVGLPALAGLLALGAFRRRNGQQPPQP